jgi:hypothetical protein
MGDASEKCGLDVRGGTEGRGDKRKQGGSLAGKIEHVSARRAVKTVLFKEMMLVWIECAKGISGRQVMNVGTLNM